MVDSPLLAKPQWIDRMYPSTGGQWHRFEQLDYYRVQARNGKALIFYDLGAQRATFQSPIGDIVALNQEALPQDHRHGTSPYNC